MGVSFSLAAVEPQESRFTQGDECSVCEPAPGTLYLYSKDPHTWEIRPSGARARLEFSRVDNTFNLRAHALKRETPYVLIQYESCYPRGTGYIMKLGVSDTRGDLHLQGQWRRWKGKFWLVPQTDVSGQPDDAELDQLKSWNPKAYLFEGRVL